MPAAERPPEPPARVPPVVVPRWVQMALLPIALLAVYALATAAGRVVLLVIVASLVALLLNPFVTVLRRRRVPRGPAVALTFIALVLLLGGCGALAANPVADQVSSFQENVPSYVDGANDALLDFQGFLDDRGIDVEIVAQGRTALQTIGDQLGGGAGDIVRITREALTLIVEGSLALILIIVLAVYMLLYGEKIGAGVRRIVPTGDGSREDDFPTRIQAAVLGYVRGQLLFSLIMGASAGVMLWILGSVGIFPDGRTYALAFGIFFAFAELIPYIGPAIGAAPPILIAAFGADPIDAVWLIVAFTALQQLEGHVVAPNVFGAALRINPILVILALLLGNQLFGLVGAFIALPVAAMLRETVVYLSHHLVLEPWPRAAVGPALAGAGTGVAAVEGEPCPECGTLVAPGTAECPACGTELADDAAARASAPG
jgi:predicted PurR-regulated permease PerM